MEFVLQTDLAKLVPKSIDFNHEDLKKYLAERLEYYNNLVVTEDSAQSAKKDRAGLNNLSAAIDAKRRDVKRAYLAPYNDFEAKIKELTGMIKAPADAIDKQVKGFEEKKRREKYGAIEAFYDDQIGDLKDILPLERIVPAKWANATTSMASIEKEISDAIEKTSNELAVIKAMELPFETQVIDTYLRTLSVGDALAEKVRLEEREKLLAATPATAPKPPESPKEPMPEFASPVVPSPACETEETKDIKVIFYGTTEAFRREMKALTERHGIKYGGLK